MGEANKLGIPVGTHVDGSATLRATIDAILAARKAGYYVPNNILHHYFWATDEDHAKVIQNNIQVNATPEFTTDWEGQDISAQKLLGDERIRTEFGRYSDLLNLGKNVSIASDVPSSPNDMMAPLLNVEIAITLMDPTNPDSNPFPPSQIPSSLENALRAVTIYSAIQQNMQDKIGTLEVGNWRIWWFWVRTLPRLRQPISRISKYLAQSWTAGLPIVTACKKWC